MKITRNSREITTLDEWKAAMPARIREKQWKAGRSAMELARAWVGQGQTVVPPEIVALLESSPAFRGLACVQGTPEAETRLDEFRGNTRNHDLLLLGELDGETVVISVEAKADESFGPTIGAYLARVEVQNRPSNAPKRIRQLASAIFGTPAEEVARLRYQLLHATAATLIAAAEHGATRALLVVHEFQGATSPVRIRRNHQDLHAFVARLGGGPIIAGQLTGPLAVPGAGRVPAQVELFIGKAVSRAP